MNTHTKKNTKANNTNKQNTHIYIYIYMKNVLQEVVIGDFGLPQPVEMTHTKNTQLKLNTIY